MELSDTPPVLDQRLGHYRLLQQIGAGGMGVVFRAYDERLEREVAIKILPAGALTNEEIRRRFRSEALSLAKLNHPNIATIHEFGSDHGTDFLVTEYISGRGVEEKVAGGPLDVIEVIRIGRQLADGLTAAHDQGIVHRDIKPANLRLTQDGRLKILDFGLAQFTRPQADIARTASLTASQQISGTLPYMAPEQLRGEAADPRTDIWSAGAVLYQLATGQPPFPQSNAALLIDSILNKDPKCPAEINARVPVPLQQVILKSLEKDQNRRFQSARELRTALDRAATGVTASRAGLGLRRGAMPAFAAIAAVAVILALGIYFLIGRANQAKPGSRVNGSRRSVAVLGFKNLSRRSDTAWLSTALSEMLTTELAAGDHLVMISGENVARVKNDLLLPEADSLAADTLQRLRKNLGSDYIVLGSYLDLGSSSGEEIRLDLRVQDAAAGQTVALVKTMGSEAKLNELVTQAGDELRQRLGAGQITPAEQLAINASLPSNLEASRLYAQGLEKLRNFDALSARDLLQKAVAADPTHAMTYTGLAGAWSALGYDAKAAEAAKKAFDLAGHLPRAEQLRVQGQYFEASKQWDKAIATYRILVDFSPDNLDYGLRLASVQIAAGKANDARNTISEMRRLPPPQGEDLRLDMLEIQAARAVSDFKGQQALAAKLADRGQKQGARLVVAWARQGECVAMRNLGDPKRAVTLCDEAQKIFAAAGDRGGEALAFNNLANALYDQGNLGEAKKIYANVARIDREIGNKRGMAGALDNMASVTGDEGDHQGARALSEQALALYKEVGDKSGIAETLNNLAAELLIRGDLAGAQKDFDQVLEIWRQTGTPSGTATALTNLGDVRLALGDLANSKAAYEEAFRLFRDNGERSKSAYPLIGLADVLTASGNFVDARKHYDEAVALTRETGDKHEQAVALAGLGILLQDRGELDAAQQSLENAMSLRDELGEKEGAAEVRLAFANLLLDRGRASEAEASARKALDEFRAEKMLDRQAQAQGALASAMFTQGRMVEARKLISIARPVAERTQQVSIRLEFVTQASLLQASSGTPANVDAGLAALARISRDAQKLGLPRYDFAARLAAGEILLKHRPSTSARTQLQAVEKDARSAGFLLIAEKAAALLKN